MSDTDPVEVLLWMILAFVVTALVLLVAYIF